MKSIQTFVLLVGLLPVLSLGASVSADETETKPSGAKLRVGTFDSRAVAGAYYGSDAFHDLLKGLTAEHEKAKAAGDKKRVKELEAEGPALQELAHKQVFGTWPVDNILAKIKGEIPKIAKQADVDVIVSKWDVVYQRSGVEFVDVTDLMVQRFKKPAANDDDVLGRFVGVWKLSTTAKPAKWLPEGGTFTGQESTVWALKNRCILIRDVSQPDGRKGLWIATYDPQQDAYPFWGFDSKGLTGGQWLLTWDDATNTATGIGTDMPADWTSSGKNQFPNADTNLVTAWIKDENGELMLDHEGKKIRQPKGDEAAIVAAWAKNDSTAARPVELKVLDRMIGTWDTVSVQKPAEWTPEGGRTTATIERAWILDGRFVMDTSLHSDGKESLALIGFDPLRKTYRSWWFNSEGNHSQSQGKWNEATQTLTYKSDLGDGKTMDSSVRFAEQNREDWKFKVTDADGNVYFDVEITATRQAD